MAEHSGRASLLALRGHCHHVQRVLDHADLPLEIHPAELLAHFLRGADESVVEAFQKRGHCEAARQATKKEVRRFARHASMIVQSSDSGSSVGLVHRRSSRKFGSRL